MREFLRNLKIKGVKKYYYCHSPLLSVENSFGPYYVFSSFLSSIQEAVYVEHLNQVAVNSEAEPRRATKSFKGPPATHPQAATSHPQLSIPPSIHPSRFLQSSRRTHCLPAPSQLLHHLLSIPGACSVCSVISIPYDAPA